MMRRAFIYGGLAAVLSAAWTLAEYALGLHGRYAEVGRYTGFLALIFPVLAITLALRDARNAHGALTLRSGIVEGMAVSVVLAVLGAVFFWCYFTLINPAFQPTGESIDAGSQAMIVFVSSLIAGLIISVVASFAMRSRALAR